nr:hypothetical protein [Mesorhizobium sp. ES1-4]
MLRRSMMCTPYMELIFPRLATGRSDTEADPYAITSLDEAGAYLQLPTGRSLSGMCRRTATTFQSRRWFDGQIDEGTMRKLYSMS